MKKTVLFFTMFYALFLFNAKSQTLIWSDEFNGTTLDQNNWNYETGTGLNGDWGTCQQDAATDRPENVDIIHGLSGADGGAVAITTTNERYRVPGGGVRNYTSGRINTQGKQSWGPGHQIKARIWARDVRYIGQGFAFWAMPDEIPPGETSLMWPQGGEIDIFEYNGQHPYSNLGSVHYAWNWNNNEWMDGNHLHQGGYYDFEAQQAPAENPQWLQVDLGQTYNINRVVLNWEFAHASAYQIQVSDDGVNWTDIYSTSIGDGGIDDIALSGSGRYVRMYGTQRGTQYGYSLWEMEVYESSTNLASNKPALSSSEENTSLTADQAVDGNNTTRWASGSLYDQDGPVPAELDNPYTAMYTWHEYGINWYQDRIEFFCDGAVYHIHYLNDGGRFTVDGENQEAINIVNGQRTLESEFSNRFSEWYPFEHKFFLILSAGVGGSCTYGGSIVPEAVFPASVFIDWVRVYDMDGTGNSLPTAVFTQNATDLTVDFDGSSSSDTDGTITDWAWDFGDGNTGNGEFVSHTYAASGSYNVALTVTDDGGATNTTNKTIAVNDGTTTNPLSIHVQSIVTGTQDAGRGSKYGTALVTIHDDLENPVAGVTVTGTLSGTFNETVNGVTGTDGTVLLTSTTTAKGGVTVDLCVDDLVHGSLIYESSLNDITCTGSDQKITSDFTNVLNVPLTFKVYPNPVNDMLNIKLSGDKSKAIIAIYDLSGKKLHTETKISSDNLSIDMSSFKRGVYILKVVTPSLVQTMNLLKK